MAQFSHAAVVLEASLEGLLTPPKRSAVKPSQVIGTLVSWCVAFKVQLLFADSRYLAGVLTQRYLEVCWRQINSDRNRSVAA